MKETERKKTAQKKRKDVIIVIVINKAVTAGNGDRKIISGKMFEKRAQVIERKGKNGIRIE